MATDTLDLGTMQASAERACGLMQILAHPDRLLILCQLSQQLTVLRKAELVTTRREGRNVHYSLVEGPALEVIDILYQHFCARSTRSKRR
jgi:DNA-binding transcriptional ArsR family regulator